LVAGGFRSLASSRRATPANNPSRSVPSSRFRLLRRSIQFARRLFALSIRSSLHRRDVGRSLSRATIKLTGHFPPGESSRMPGSSAISRSNVETSSSGRKSTAAVASKPRQMRRLSVFCNSPGSPGSTPVSSDSSSSPSCRFGRPRPGFGRPCRSLCMSSYRCPIASEPPISAIRAFLD
jgi:hypothetical protein